MVIFFAGILVSQCFHSSTQEDDDLIPENGVILLIGSDAFSTGETVCEQETITAEFYKESKLRMQTLLEVRLRAGVRPSLLFPSGSKPARRLQ